MTIHLGYIPASSTLYIPFTSYSSAGASVTLTGLAVTDIEIYKNGSVTQRSSDAGYTLLDTDGIDFDGITGLHGFSIDLSDNTDAGFYAAGSFYWVVVSAVTIDSQTVNFIAATFYIGPQASNVTQFGGTAGTFSSGRPEVNSTHFAAQAITAAAPVTIPASIASPTNITAGTITTATSVTNGVTVTTNNDKTGYRLSATGVDDILDEVVEGTLTVRQIIRLELAALAGKSSGGGTNTVEFRDNADSKARISATVDADGNRSAVTLDAT